MTTRSNSANFSPEGLAPGARIEWEQRTRRIKPIAGADTFPWPIHTEFLIVVPDPDHPVPSFVSLPPIDSATETETYSIMLLSPSGAPVPPCAIYRNDGTVNEAEPGSIPLTHPNEVRHFVRHVEHGLQTWYSWTCYGGQEPPP